MSINPKSLKKLWEIQQSFKRNRKVLDPLRRVDNRIYKPTDYVQQMNVSDTDKNMDDDLTGMGGTSLGVGIPDTPLASQ